VIRFGPKAIADQSRVRVWRDRAWSQYALRKPTPHRRAAVSQTEKQQSYQKQEARFEMGFHFLGNVA